LPIKRKIKYHKQNILLETLRVMSEEALNHRYK
jgi:hypothetical protein